MEKRAKHNDSCLPPPVALTQKKGTSQTLGIVFCCFQVIFYTGYSILLAVMYLKQAASVSQKEFLYEQYG